MLPAAWFPTVPLPERGGRLCWNGGMKTVFRLRTRAAQPADPCVPGALSRQLPSLHALATGPRAPAARSGARAAGG
ncbi:hypothetical protein GmRootA79_13520 [Acidovorax sp. A79]